jgi:DNA-binding transcriptional regulator YiaG
MISQQKIVSPLTGGEAVYQKEMRETEYRGEKFVYEHHNIRDLETNLEFTNTEIDEGNVQRVYSQYRAKHNIPSPRELTEIREMYGLSAAKMSEILGIGTNQYRLYEDGVMPSEAIGKMLRSIQTPAVFLGYVEGCKNQMPEAEYNKLCQKIQKHLILDLKKSNSISWFRELFSPRVLGKVAL